jgi:hypothetical protein
MAFEAATLAVASSLHLSGLDQGTSTSFNLGAGTVEAVLCVVMAAGAIPVLRGTAWSRPVAIGTVGFTILGFAYGLSITARSGHMADIAYHVAMLPILVFTLIALARNGRTSAPRSVNWR